MVRDEAPDARQKRSDHHRWRSGDPGMGIVGWQACHSRLLWRLRRSGGFKKTSQFRRCPELWDRIEFLERRGERIRQAPHGSRLELLGLWIEVEFVHSPCQMLRDLQISLDERTVNCQLGRLC